MADGNRASPCFTPGTVIATDRGQRPVEEISIGDRVVTADNGLKPVVWIGKRTLMRRELFRLEELRPILIRAGALGEGRPDRDMIVSPKHRFLVAWPSADGILQDLLVPAARLVDHKSIRPANALGVTYIHLMCEAHQVLLAEGAWTESFRPDRTTWQTLGNAQRLEIEALFPEARSGGLERLADPARPLDDRPLWKQRMRPVGSVNVRG